MPVENLQSKKWFNLCDARSKGVFNLGKTYRVEPLFTNFKGEYKNVVSCEEGWELVAISLDEEKNLVYFKDVKPYQIKTPQC